MDGARLDFAIVGGAVMVVGGWANHAVFSKDLLTAARPDLLKFDGRTIELNPANGRATYRVIRDDGREVSARLIKGEVTGG